MRRRSSDLSPLSTAVARLVLFRAILILAFFPQGKFCFFTSLNVYSSYYLYSTSLLLCFIIIFFLVGRGINNGKAPLGYSLLPANPNALKFKFYSEFICFVIGGLFSSLVCNYWLKVI